MEGQQLWTDLQKANEEIRRLSAENGAMREVLQRIADSGIETHMSWAWIAGRAKQVLASVSTEQTPVLPETATEKDCSQNGSKDA